MRSAALALLLVLAAAPAAAQCGWTVSPGTVCDRQWRPPVAALVDLPGTGNTIGDARVVLDESSVYVWDGAAWMQAQIGGDTGPVPDCTGTDTQLADGSCVDVALEAELVAHAGDADAHHAPTVDTDDQTAAEVAITDAGALYTAIDVEGALQESPPGPRAPTAHAATHAAAAGDELLAESLGTTCLDDEVLVASAGTWTCAEAASGVATEIDQDGDTFPEISADSVDEIFFDARSDDSWDWRMVGASVNEHLLLTPGYTGFYVTSNTLEFIAGASGYWRLSSSTGGRLESAGGTGASMRSSGTSFTIPGLMPVATDTNTGIGGDGADALSMVAGGVAGYTCRTDGSGTTCWLSAQAAAPTCDQIGKEYTDTTAPGADCWCDGVNWQVRTGGGTCT